jgi:DNA-binding transcriptional regulator/RsmH inhibitor MraZ
MVATGTINAETSLVAGATGGSTANEVIKIVGAADREWWVDTTNVDQLKKHQSMRFSADPGSTHASTLMQFLVDGSNTMEIDSNLHVKVPNNLIVGSTGTPGQEVEIVGRLRLTGAGSADIWSSTATGREILYITGKTSSTDSARLLLFGDTDSGEIAGGVRVQTGNANAFEIDNSQRVKVNTSLIHFTHSRKHRQCK